MYVGDYGFVMENPAEALREMKRIQSENPSPLLEQMIADAEQEIVRNDNVKKDA